MNVYNNLQELKARLFELLEDKEKQANEIEQIKQELADTRVELDGVRGELGKALNIADSRGRMVRELSREKQILIRNQAIQKDEITPEIIAEVTRILTHSTEKVVINSGGFHF